jgi:hypothetical protein
VTVVGSDGLRRDVGMTVSIGIATWPDIPAERDDLVAAARPYWPKPRARPLYAAPLQQPDGTVPGDTSC